MKLLIIEDEPLVAKDLAQLVQRVAPDATVVAILESVEEAKNWLSQHTAPDLILSDIQLSDGVSFDIFEEVEVPCPFVFTTAYDEFALKAFKLNSIDYLLKPINREELARALQKYKNLQASHLAADQIKHLLQSLAHTQEPKYKERFLAVVKHALVPVPTPEIALFQKDELIFLHTWDGQRLVAESHSLEEIEHVVDPKVYYRVNRQALVHINAIGKVENTYKGMCLTLKAPLHMELDLSRQKVTHFKKWLEG